MAFSLNLIIEDYKKTLIARKKKNLSHNKAKEFLFLVKFYNQIKKSKGSCKYFHN